MPIATLSGPLLADRGADFHFVVTYTDANGDPVDLTAGWDVEFVWPSDQSGLTPLTVGAGLTVDSDGTITGLVPAAVTDTWSFSSTSFEIFVTSPQGARDVLLAGAVKLGGQRFT